MICRLLDIFNNKYTMINYVFGKRTLVSLSVFKYSQQIDWSWILQSNYCEYLNTENNDNIAFIQKCQLAKQTMGMFLRQSSPSEKEGHLKAGAIVSTVEHHDGDQPAQPMEESEDSTQAMGMAEASPEREVAWVFSRLIDVYKHTHLSYIHWNYHHQKSYNKYFNEVWNAF